MPTLYYWLEGDDPQGPVPFRELVEMVRDQRLVESDLVRPDYSKEWQAAETVIGLFYMASRDSAADEPLQTLLVDQFSNGTEFQADDIGEMLARSEELSNQEGEIQIADLHDSEHASSMTGLQPAAFGISMPQIAVASSIPAAPSVFCRIGRWIVSHRFTLAGTVAMVVAGWIFGIYAFRVSSEKNFYQELTAILNSLDDERRSPSPNYEAIRFRIERVIRDYPPRLLRDGASRQKIVKLKLLFVTRDLMPALLRTDLSSPSIEEFHMMTCLKEVGDSLGIKE